MTNRGNLRRWILVILPWSLWGLACLLYFHQYFLRVYFQNLLPQLKSQYHVTNETFSDIAAVFFCCLIFAQMFAGYLVDKFGSKRIVPISALLIAISCFLMTATWKSVFLLMISRILLALGGGLSLICVLSILRAYFSKNSFSFFCGLTMATGMLGAFLGAGSLGRFLSTSHAVWTRIFQYAGIFALLIFVISILVMIFWPDPRGKNTAVNSHNFRFADVIKNIQTKNIWPVILYPGAISLVIDAYASVWALEYLRISTHFSLTDEANINSAIFLGLMIGSIGMNALVARFGHVTKFMKSSILLVLILVVVVLYLPPTSYRLFISLHFILGFFCASISLPFIYFRITMPVHILGTLFSVLELSKHAVSAVSLQVIGFIFHLESGHPHHKLTHLTATDFHYSLAIIPILITLVMIWTFRLKPIDHLS